MIYRRRTIRGLSTTGAATKSNALKKSMNEFTNRVHGSESKWRRDLVCLLVQVTYQFLEPELSPPFLFIVGRYSNPKKIGLYGTGQLGIIKFFRFIKVQDTFQSIKHCNRNDEGKEEGPS